MGEGRGGVKEASGIFSHLPFRKGGWGDFERIPDWFRIGRVRGIPKVTPSKRAGARVLFLIFY